MGLNQKHDWRHKPPEQIESEEIENCWYARLRYPGSSTSKGDLPTERHWTTHYFNNKSPEWWLDRNTFDKNIKEKVLPNAISHIIRNNFLTIEEGDNLKRMIVSPDPENFMVAIIVIIKYKKEIKKLRKHAKF